MPDSIGTLFFKDKQVKLLLTLNDTPREWHIADLAKEANVTYIHTTKFVNKCEEMGLISTERHGRIKRLYLTDKGTAVAKEIVTTMGKVTNNSKEEPKKKEEPQQPKKEA
ncbi:MAG: winged helix-turn-helix transcriptional regulator [Candidatus Micrarchaeota archaeon]|nr:winged helix-turn-helix transcriptional regulator [Candidatus Micrarchaeota archaeon]MDE1849845.1 winged helix-turn-helix transcriptional regulator [Candidatus Micrarchaeota archaeon]